MNELKIYKMYEDVNSPVFASEGSACFDMHAYLKTGQDIQIFSDTASRAVEKPIKLEDRFILYPNERALIPTGIIFDIPVGHSVRLHARSGLAFTRGLTLANGEGIIDNDYVEHVYVMLVNNSDMNAIINNHDRICQGELVEDLKYVLSEISDPPKTKTSRNGGFGSTGV